MGGVSFDLSNLTFFNSDTLLNENILQDPNVVYPSSSMRLQFTNQTTGNPLAFISNINLRSQDMMKKFYLILKIVCAMENQNILK